MVSKTQFYSDNFLLYKTRSYHMILNNHLESGVGRQEAGSLFLLQFLF